MSRRSIGRVLAVLGVAMVGSLVGITPSQAASNTVVSLTFDDGQSSQYATLPILQSHGMTGTFYIESGDVGAGSYYMNWAQIGDLAQAGNEIGGHTLHHTDLTAVSAAEATTAVCDDRTNLQSHGYQPTSFAYPYATVNAGVESIVKSCGYSSGRTVGGGTESIPPSDAYRVRTAAPADSGTGLAGLQSSVTSAENSGGGWVVIVFHGVCDNSCTGSSSTSLSTFTSFLDWLQSRSAGGTVVRTVGDVMSGGTMPPPPPPPPANAAPTTAIACNGAACSTTAYSAAVSVTLSATDPEGSATTTYYTTDGTDPRSSGTRQTYGGAFSVATSSTVMYFSTDSAGAAETPKSQQIQVTAAPPPNQPPPNQPPPNQPPPNQPPPVQPPPVQPPPATNLAPTTSVTCNGVPCSLGWYRTSPVRVTLTARDPEGAATTTYYTTDGTDPVTSTSRRTYDGTFAVAETGTVKFYSTDASSQREATKSQEIRIDTVAPRVVISSPRAGSVYGHHAKRQGGIVSAGAVDRATGTKSASGVARVVFYDGRKRIGVTTAPVPGTSTYRVSWHPRPFRPGKHLLTAVVTDAAGNTARSRPVTVYLRRH